MYSYNMLGPQELSDSFNGNLFRALANFTVVLCENNSLIHHVQLASSWPCDSLS